MLLDRVPKIDILPLSGLLLCLATVSFSQVDNRARNNPYSTNPTSKTKPEGTAGIVKPILNNVAFVAPDKPSQDDDVRPTVVQRTAKKTTDLKPRPLTEIYKIGAGDV